MYDFVERKKISARIANPAHIPVYRELLAARRVPSGMRMANQLDLAKALVYEALGHYSEEEIQAATNPQRAAAAPAVQSAASPAVGNAIAAVKKKSQNLKAIPASVGKIWTISRSVLRTLSSRIASTATAVSKLWKKS